MKFLSTRFEDYINECKKMNIHEKMEPLLKSQGNEIEKLNHMIFYGPSGIGKYTQSINFIKKFSPSELKYERKISYRYNNKYEYTFKLSDIHFEIDLELLGCNAKLLFNELYYHILDVCNTRQRVNNIIICKNFHKIHPELLENFYSYMQTLEHKNVNLIYILLTEQISFLPNSILNRCKIIPFSKPSNTIYKKISKNNNVDKKNITNLKDAFLKIKKNSKKNNTIINTIYKNIVDYKNIEFLNLRDICYDIFIYDIDLNETLFIIICRLINENYLDIEKLNDVLLNFHSFLKYYNNNYRPIYHLEKFLFQIIEKVHL
jgi:DNA polymerase III delta prime subunit